MFNPRCPELVSQQQLTLLFPLSLPLLLLFLLPPPPPPPHGVCFHEDTGGAPEAELPASGARALHVGGDIEAVPAADGPPGPPGAVHAAGFAGRDRSLPRPQHRHQVLGCRKGAVAVQCGAMRRGHDSWPLFVSNLR